MTPRADFPTETWHRPDGTNPEVYKALAAEGRHRLAWEWLIRIEAFQQDCQAVRIGYVDAAAVAGSWDLYRFKPFYEPYSTQRKPRFLVSTVRLFRAKNGQLMRHIAILKSEMAIVFEVERMVHSLDSRDAQIATAIRLLDAAINRRRQRNQIAPDSRSRVNVAHLDACLQLADLLHRACPSDEIKLKVEYLRDTTDANSTNGRFRDMKTRIADLVHARGYLNLANRAHG